MTAAANNLALADLAVTPVDDAATTVASLAAYRVVAQLEGADVCVARVTSTGTLECITPGVSRFFMRYALPAIASLKDPWLATDPLAQQVPGIAVRAVEVHTKRMTHGASAQPQLMLIARTLVALDATSEELQGWCRRLELDARWLAEEAAGVVPVAPTTLSRLAELVSTVAATDQHAASLRMELDSLSSQLSDTYEELSLIYQLSSGMRVNRKPDEFFLQACTEVLEVMGVRAAGYAVIDAGGNVETSSVFGASQPEAAVVERLLRALQKRFQNLPKPLLNNRLRDDPDLSFLAEAAGQIVAVPIQRQDKMLGLLFCLDKRGADFTTQDSKLLNSIANETAIYLENSNLFSDARGMMMGLLHALTSAVDAKDTYTCGHSQRVALFGREIAIRAGLSEALCERVYMAGLLHDVGKIGVPEDVLRKPGKLTDEEFGLMKLHVEIGARILKDVRQIGDLIPGVLYHHERYDGKGYPHQLAGQGIPMIARILCVADCFDAMTSNRTYRKALPIEVALMEIRRCAGTQFDPVLADAFLSIGATRLRELIASVTDKMAIQLAA